MCEGVLPLPRQHATPSYLEALYRYPQRAFPYADLVAENGRRGRDQPEYELEDTRIFAEGRFFDVVVEYAKVTDAFFDLPRSEADAFYSGFGGERLSADERHVQRQAFAGLLWSKQFYYFDVDVWLRGDPAGPRPSPGRAGGRNREWRHLNNANVLSMPDSWEYPWFAAWDLSFHCIPLALVDPEFAKDQLVLLLREWYMHPNGQLPAYEWAFNDVNPPVHAWAALRVYRIEGRTTDKFDLSLIHI